MSHPIIIEKIITDTSIADTANHVMKKLIVNTETVPATEGIAIISALVLFPAIIFGMIMFNRYQKRKVAELMVEKGMDPTEMYNSQGKLFHDGDPIRKLHIGLILFSIALAFFMNSMSERYAWGLDLPMWLMFFLAIAFFISYFISKGKQSDQ